MAKHENRPQLPSRRIAEELRRSISAGTIKPGDKLPSERTLAQQYKTARNTAREAIRLLAEQGLVTAQHGRGVFVRPTPHVRLLLSGSNYRRHRKLGLPGFNAQAMEQGQVAEQRLLKVATVAAPAEIALQLDLDDQAPVVLRRRLFLVNDQPVALCDSYYPLDLAAGTPIADHERIKGGVHALIEDPQGPIRRRVSRSVDNLVARMPTQSEVDLLRLPIGVPVIRVLRTIYDTNREPLEVQDSIAAADRHEFQYEVKMR